MRTVFQQVSAPRRCVIVCIAIAAGLLASTASAQSPANVAVIINATSADSQLVGDYYVRERGIPASNVIRIATSHSETIDYATFIATIQQPIALALRREGLQDRVLYIVLTKGIPHRIAGTNGVDGTGASVDSELTLLYRRMTGQEATVRGTVDNPYFLGARPISAARPFTHREHDIYLVSRLDAFTVEEAFALIDRARNPTTDGRIVLDQRGTPANRAGEEWLAAAAERLTKAGEGGRVLLESTPAAAVTTEPVLGYFSWGSADPQNRVRDYGMRFVPGALAATFVSTDARTFAEPPRAWIPVHDTPNRASWFGSSAQSLVGDLIRKGATGVAGNVAEPYLQSTVRPDVLFSAYLAGFNLIESFYLAIPHLGWQTVVIGDPLCAPFGGALAREALEDTIDPATELPVDFSRRRVADGIAKQRAVPREAIVLAVRAENLIVRNDRAGAREALERATALAPRIVENHFVLAQLYEELAQYDLAIERYRRVLQLQPDHLVSLNNLAYALAVRKGLPAEALGLARQAAMLAPHIGSVLDTYGWVQHLLGDDAAAGRALAEAVRKAPGIPTIRLHAAIVYSARGQREAAEVELKEALRLDPKLEDSEDVRTVRARLAELAAPK